MRKRTLGALILPLVVLGLELLPYGAVLNFGRPAEDGSIGFFRETYSYFSLMPFGYGNFAPLLTAVLTCLLLLLLILFLVWKKRALWKAAGVLAGVAAILSLLPLCFGWKYYSAVGAAITVGLVLEAGYLLFAGKRLP